MKISLIEPQLLSAQEQMDEDAKLLKALNPKGDPLIRFYKWKSPSVTYGHFTKPFDFLNPKGLEKWGIDCGKRITGGGITLHFSDLAFAFFMPKDHPHFSENTLENYAFVNKVVAKALAFKCPFDQLHFYQGDSANKNEDAFYFCMGKATKYDLLYKEQKIAGAAQRKTLNGYLHHGSIALAQPDPHLLEDILIKGSNLKDLILQNHFYFLKSHKDTQALEELREEIKRELIKAFEAV